MVTGVCCAEGPDSLSLLLPLCSGRAKRKKKKETVVNADRKRRATLSAE